MAIKYDKILNDIREADTTTKGDTGVDGDTGVAGPKGDTGTQGDTGAGLQGDTGADSTVQGDTGVKGDTGVQGDSGYVGSDGDTGVKGDTGSTGAKGDTGTAGSQGDTGSTGSQGDQGDTGSTGSAGAKGDTGVAGTKGDTGTTGNQGDTGSTGAKGDTGTTGSAGSQGDTGVQGDTGAGVQGDTGTAGSQGDTGVTGDTGTQYPWDGAWVTSTAYAVNDCVEYQGSGYVCVTAHTSGTFATDLSAGKWELLVEKGDQGDTGTAGSAGDQGDTGVAGAKGDTGTAGAKGDTGTAGAKGDTGTAGTQGDTGVTGAVGDTGVAGDTGVGTADGWIDADETWTYASASTITVPSGAASRYSKGDRIKWTQTTVKYGVIVSVADTVLTIAVNTDYTVANAAITNNYYSHQASPVGYPGWFNWTPNGTGYTAGNSKFSINHGVCAVIVQSSAPITGNITNLPIASANPAPTAEAICDPRTARFYISTNSSTLGRVNDAYGINIFYFI